MKHPYKFSVSLILISLWSLLIYNNSTTGLVNRDIDNIEENYESIYISDEIEPFCNGIDAEKYYSLTNLDINYIKINLNDKGDWYRNFFKVIQANEYRILPEYKIWFKAGLEVVYLDGTVCDFKAKVKLTGDYQDHIMYDGKNYSEDKTSLEVRLLEGNIFGITKFKLFLPESRYDENEFIVTTILEKFGILTPRTYSFNVVFNNSDTRYIFQEVPSKEFTESNFLREGPLLSYSEEFFWEDSLTINQSLSSFADIDNKYWARDSLINQNISLEALGKLNRILFLSDSSKYLSSRNKITYDFRDPNYYEILKFDMLMIALDAEHGLSFTNRRFYYDNIVDNFLPIYYDGDSQVARRQLLSYQKAEKRYVDDVDEYCNYLNDWGYENRYVCVNNYDFFVNDLIKEINFTADDLFYSIKAKGYDIEYDVVDFAYQNFIDNFNLLLEPKPDLPPVSQAFQIKNNNFFENTLEREFNFLFYDYQEDYGEICDKHLKKCEEFYERINLFQNNLPEKFQNSYPFGQNLRMLFNENVDKESISEYDSFFKVFGNPTVIIENNTKKFTVFFTSKEQRVLILSSEVLKDWKFEFKSDLQLDKADNRYDNNSLTGCVTFYKTVVEDISIYSENLHCEDAVNLIKVDGNIKNVEIYNSKSDSLDIDFSNLELKSLSIKSAGNDCLDTSFSEVVVIDAKIENCKDKAVSFGEKSNISLLKSSILNSNIGLAVKDSSNVTVGDILIENVNLCIAAYRKKQEFGPVIININQYSCESKHTNFVQDGSLLKIEK